LASAKPAWRRSCRWPWQRFAARTSEENPFLERFYQSHKQFALPTQLFFLFQRARQMQEWKQRDLFAPTRVADFLLEKDGCSRA